MDLTYRDMLTTKINVEDIIIRDELNKLSRCFFNESKYNREDNAHRIFQYPAMMLPITQESILDSIKQYLPSNPKMIDPFMGSGTTLVSSMKSGFNVFGQDINPLAVLLSKVKTGPYLCETFDEGFYRIIESYEQDSSDKVDIYFKNMDKWFRKDTQIELSKLRRAVIKLNSIYSRRFFWVVFSEVIRLTSNDRTSTYKLHMRPIDEINNRQLNLFNEVKRIAKRNISDLKKLRTCLSMEKLIKNDIYCRDINIKLADTKTVINMHGEFDLLISSPPYGDNHTTVPYGQHSFLPLNWINLEDLEIPLTHDYLMTTREIDTQSLGGKALSLSKCDLEILFQLSPTLCTFYNMLNDDEQRKAKKLLFFISDFNKSLDIIIRSLSLNSLSVWTIGNRHIAGREVRNDKILKELLEAKGLYEIITLERFINNKRMPSKNSYSKTMNKEKILVFRKPF